MFVAVCADMVCVAFPLVSIVCTGSDEEPICGTILYYIIVYPHERKPLVM